MPADERESCGTLDAGPAFSRAGVRFAESVTSLTPMRLERAIR